MTRPRTRLRRRLIRTRLGRITFVVHDELDAASEDKLPAEDEILSGDHYANLPVRDSLEPLYK
jgi:hypothetical protein